MAEAYTIAPAEIAALPLDQKIVLRAAITLDDMTPADFYPLTRPTAGQLAHLAGLDYNAALAAADALWVAGYLECFRCTSADNADRSFTVYQLTDTARRSGQWLLRHIEHSLDDETLP